MCNGKPSDDAFTLHMTHNTLHKSITENSQDRPQKIVTLSEAEALLPKVKPLIEQLQGLQRSIIQTNKQLDELVGKLSAGNGYPIQSLKTEIQHVTEHQLRLIEAFQSALQQLEDLGAMLKHVNAGLIDFYSTREGELIFLCWKLGEERIQFWHTLEDGFAGRRPLE